MEIMKNIEDPILPIIKHPWKYKITNINWFAGSKFEESYFDITFQKGEGIYLLRFLSPSDIQINISGSYPADCGEMAITDVRNRGIKVKE
jgi:hypothetical protein